MIIQGTEYSIEHFGDDYVLIARGHQVVIEGGYADLRSECIDACSTDFGGDHGIDYDGGEVNELINRREEEYCIENFTKGVFQYE